MDYLLSERLDVVAVRLRDEIEEQYPQGVRRADKLVMLVRAALEDPAPDFAESYGACYAIMTEMIQTQRNDANENVPRLLGGYKLLAGRLAAAVKDPTDLEARPVFVERYTYGFIAVFADRILHLSLTDVE